MYNFSFFIFSCIVLDFTIIIFCNTIYRKDRDHLTSNRERGGGVFIAVKRNISTELLTTNNTDIEQVFIKIKCFKSDIIIGCVYIPPQSSIDTYNKHLATISHLKERYSNCELMIVGDYNLPSSYPSTDCENVVYSEMLLNNCQQFNEICNVNDKTLDLCFSSADVKVKRTEAIVNEDKHHPVLNIQVEIQANVKTNNTTTYNFKKADYMNLNRFFLRSNWIDLYELELVDDKVNWFYSKIYEGIVQFVPIYDGNGKNYPCWFSKELIQKTKQKKRAHTKYKKLGTKAAHNQFRELRLECKKMSEKCYDDYISKIEGMMKIDIKQFWKFIKNKRRSDLNIPSTMSWNEKIATNGSEVSNLFALYFESIYSSNLNDSTITDENGNEEPSANLDADLTKFTIRYDDVFQQLCKLDVKKGAGPDGIPNEFLRNCAIGLAEPLSHIFSKSVESGIFPTAWKISYISPIHKSGSKSIVTNYRPVCIQSSISKLFEKIILPQIIFPFKNIISTKQHGFIKGRSTNTNLYLYTNYVLNQMNQGNNVHAVYTDFSKAFDTVDYDILCDKLNQYGVRDKALGWFRSYLTGRYHQVRVNGHISTEYEVTSGVPQGSHLGPILFNIFINDIGDKFRSEYLLYADDLKIFRKITDDYDVHVLQQDIDELNNWCSRNKLKLNLSKCVVISFSRSAQRQPAIYYLPGHHLEEVTFTEDLGVIIDNKLNFSNHVNKMISRTAQTLGFILRFGKEFNNVHTLIHLYSTLVRPKLEYCSTIWSPYTDTLVEKIENIQKKFCKFVKYYMGTGGQRINIDEVYNQFNIDSLSRRRRITDLTFFYKIINWQIDCPEILEQFEFVCPKLGLRSNRLLNSVGTTKNYVHHGPKNRIVNLVNEYCSDLEFFGGSISSFLSQIEKCGAL